VSGECGPGTTQLPCECHASSKGVQTRCSLFPPLRPSYLDLTGLKGCWGLTSGLMNKMPADTFEHLGRISDDPPEGSVKEKLRVLLSVAARECPITSVWSLALFHKCLPCNF
jgi:hypothetical protein